MKKPDERILVMVCHRHKRCSTGKNWHNMSGDTYTVLLNLIPIKYKQSPCDMCEKVKPSE